MVIRWRRSRERRMYERELRGIFDVLIFEKDGRDRERLGENEREERDCVVK